MRLSVDLINEASFTGEAVHWVNPIHKTWIYTRLHAPMSIASRKIRQGLGISDQHMKEIGEKNPFHFKMIGTVQNSNDLKKASPIWHALTSCGLGALYTQFRAYSIHYILYHFFEAAMSPEDGDLVVYHGPEKGYTKFSLAGIFKTQCNGKVVPGGTVISKYSVSSSHLFQHEVFFAPIHCGEFAAFFRLKKDRISPSIKAPAIITYSVYEDYFSYEPSDFTRLVRRCFEEIPAHDLQKCHQLKNLHIKFKGTSFQYAFGHILGTYVAPPESMNNDEIFMKYFDITIQPQEGDLAVYYRNDSRTHFGIYVSDNCIKSKWKDYHIQRKRSLKRIPGAVYMHAYFDLPTSFGYFLEFLRPKPGLTPKMLYENLQLDEEGRDAQAPVILNDDKELLGSQTLLLFSYKKPIPAKARPRSGKNVSPGLKIHISNG